MARKEEYITYEQVLQELQINRSQLNQLIREGRIREHVISGETRFSLSETLQVKETLEKHPTVMETEGRAGEPTTDVLGEGKPAARGPGEPATEILEEKAAVRETEVLGEPPTSHVAERDTEVLEEEVELEEPAAAATETALETELDLKAAPAQKAPAKAPAEEEGFDFGLETEPEFELEAPTVQKPAAAAPPEEAKTPEAGEEEVVTEVLDLGKEEELVPEEDLLSEIMEIEEEAPAKAPAAPTPGAPEETEDITAEITTVEEPTYEGTSLEEALAVSEEAPPAPEIPEAGELEIPVPTPTAAAELRVGALWVALLIATLVVMLFASLFVIENGSRPEFSTPLTSWVRKG